MKIYLITSGLAFFFIAIIHTCRIIFNWPVLVNGLPISRAVDAGTIIVTLVLATVAFYFVNRH